MQSERSATGAFFMEGNDPAAPRYGCLLSFDAGAGAMNRSQIAEACVCLKRLRLQSFGPLGTMVVQLVAIDQDVEPAVVVAGSEAPPRGPILWQGKFIFGSRNYGMKYADGSTMETVAGVSTLPDIDAHSLPGWSPELKAALGVPLKAGQQVAVYCKWTPRIDSVLDIGVYSPAAVAVAIDYMRKGGCNEASECE